MSSPNLELLRGLIAFAEDGEGPDAFAAALYAHPLIGPHITFSLDAVRDSLASNEQSYRVLIDALAKSMADAIAESLKKSLRH